MNISPELLASLFVPPVPFTPAAGNDDEFKVTRVVVDGVAIRYKDDDWGIVMTVEGELPAAAVDTLSSDLLTKLERIQGQPCEVRPV